MFVFLYSTNSKLYICTALSMFLAFLVCSPATARKTHGIQGRRLIFVVSIFDSLYRLAITLSVVLMDANDTSFHMQGNEEGKLVLELDDSFHRLQAHGLAEFHGLASHSEPSTSDPDRRVTVIQQATAKSAQQTHQRLDVSQPVLCEITCADILMALEDRPNGGMNPSVLRRYMAGHSTESDAASEDFRLM